MKEHFNWIRKSSTMYFAALLLAVPEILAFLPSVKDSVPPEMYTLVYKCTVGLFILTRIRAQLKFNAEKP